MPPKPPPEKIKIDPPAYDRALQRFGLGFATKFGAATGSNEADFTILVDVTVRSGDTVVKRFDRTRHIVTPDSRAATRDDGLTQLVGLLLDWDRNGGAATGVHEVSIAVELRNPSDESVGNGGASLSASVDIQPAPDDPR